MPHLHQHLRLDSEVPVAPNLTSRFLAEDLATLGTWVWEGYEQDLHSCEKWRTRTNAAMDLALQLQKDKTFPWPNCSNVAFPLVTIAAMQFHSRAYPAIISGTQIVKYRVPAPDPQGEALARAKRVGDYMSYQVLEEDSAWEEEHDRLMLQYSIIGCAFKKTYHNAREQHNVSELVPATNLVMDYYAKSVETCARKTQILSLYRNEVYEKCVSGVWDDFLDEAWYANPIQAAETPGQADRDRRTGRYPGMPDEATPLVFLEQHCWLDADGDGYAEPYTITIEANQKKVVRIVARWESEDDVERNARNRVLRIRATEHYTKYGLIPSPDGSVYDIGFGVLLGPLNESVNSLVNILMDSGTMSVAAGGFLSRGVKIRGGSYTFQPFGWQRVDSTGDDLRKGIVELPVREPSATLFQLLSFLVNYTQRVSGSTDTMAGENPGQNTPAQTQQSMVEQGMKIYSALFKRHWRSMKEEFGKLYRLNGRFMPLEKSFGSGKVRREDFLGDPSKICPVADPNITSDLMRLQQASAVAERARAVSGYDPEQAERNLLLAMRVDGIDQIYPGPKKVPPLSNPKVQIEQLRQQIAEKKLQQDMMQFVVEMQEEQRLNSANIIKLMAEAQAIAAEAADAGSGRHIEMINLMIGAAKARDEAMRARIDQMLKGLEIAQRSQEMQQQSEQHAAEMKHASASAQ